MVHKDSLRLASDAQHCMTSRHGSITYPSEKGASWVLRLGLRAGGDGKVFSQIIAIQEAHDR